LLSKAFSGTGTITLGDNDANGNFSGVIDGQLNLIKIGAGTQVLGGTSTYSGDTTISAGSLLVNGSIASSSGVSVNDGATLGGSGDVGNVTVADGGHLAPGNSPGTLHAASLALNDASILDFELGSLAGPNDLIDITGDLTLDGILNISNLGGLDDGRYTLMTYSGSLSDNGLALGSTPGAFNYSIDTGTAGSVFLDISAVPEPGTLTLLGLGGLLALRRRRAA
jgi:autotransporter-associated beta strand protein